MRVAVVAPEFPPELGGMQTYALEFAKELAGRGHNVTVFTRPHADGELELPGVDVRPELKLSRRSDRRLLSIYRFDVWHVMNAAYAWLALETGGVVVSVHGNDFLRPYIPMVRVKFKRYPWLWRADASLDRLERRWNKWLTRRLVNRALPRTTAILANSRYTERVLLEQYPRCKGRTSAAMVGVAGTFLEQPFSTQPVHDVTRMITVCRLSEARKNVDRVLLALAALKERYPFHYTVVGEGPLHAELESLSAELGLSDRVTFTGKVSDDALKEMLSESDLFVLASSVLPHSHEGFGIVYLEAAACGTPALAARQAGAAEAIEDGVSGYFVEEPTVDQLTRALGRFLGGEIAFDRAGCRNFARGFSWARVVDAALDVYPKRG
ncbi:MAG: glycosyltransferase family 4 protein [Gammaproteobacteria bacterium]